MKSGIYRILNTKNGDYYIGSSKRIEKRWKEHINDLTKQKHYNQILQRAWNKYGKDVFKFELILECSPEKLLDVENTFLNILPKYNICSVSGGGDTISNHPNREEIIKKISKASSGSNNSNYQGKHITLDWRINQSISNSKVPIKLTHKDTKEEFIFSNSKQAAIFVGCSSGQIRNCKLNNWKVARTYFVSNVDTLINE